MECCVVDRGLEGPFVWVFLALIAPLSFLGLRGRLEDGGAFTSVFLGPATDNEDTR